MSLDFDAHYSVSGMEGIAFYLVEYCENEREVAGVCCGHTSADGPDFWLDEAIGETHYCDGWCNPETEYELDTSMVVAVMVGDNRKHIVDVDDLTLIDEEDFCYGCGQIGCGH